MKLEIKLLLQNDEYSVEILRRYISIVDELKKEYPFMFEDTLLKVEIS